MFSISSFTHDYVSRLANSRRIAYKYFMESAKKSEDLRYGWTTGACATAATKSALSALFGHGFLDPVSITVLNIMHKKTPQQHRYIIGWRRF